MWWRHSIAILVARFYEFIGNCSQLMIYNWILSDREQKNKYAIGINACFPIYLMFIVYNVMIKHFFFF